MSALMHDPHAAVVWLDHWHALVARRDNGTREIIEVDRGGAADQEYLVRVAQETEDCKRVMILGPGADLPAFRREYLVQHSQDVVALDVEASASATPSELYDRLRLLEGDELTASAR
jgi:hypothetical protein